MPLQAEDEQYEYEYQLALFNGTGVRTRMASTAPTLCRRKRA